jgi:hypothetical protein
MNQQLLNRQEFEMGEFAQHVGGGPPELQPYHETPASSKKDITLSL